MIAVSQQALDNLDIYSVAHPRLRELSAELGQTLHLAQLEGNEVMYVDKVEDRGAVKMHSRVGGVAIIHTSGLGKAIVAYLEEPRRRQVLEKLDFKRYTPTSITTGDEFERELAVTRERCWAEDNGEFEEVINCVAVPVRNSRGLVRNAISLTALQALAPLETLRQNPSSNGHCRCHLKGVRVDRLSESSTTADGAGRSNRFFDGRFAEHCVMAIVRGLPPAETVDLCERAWRAGIEVVEVPIQGPSAIASLQAAATAADRAGRKIGVGTVTTLEQVEQARRSGAVFTVAPGLDLDIARASLDSGLAHLPGAATASEVQRALASGLRWLKAFPAAQLTPGWIKALLAPFPDVCFVATGGIDAHNAQEFIMAGAKVVAIGSALNDPNQIGLLSALQNGGPRKGTIG
jgi:Entner-Doudoroff aldolase